MKLYYIIGSEYILDHIDLEKKQKVKFLISFCDRTTGFGRQFIIKELNFIPSLPNLNIFETLIIYWNKIFCSLFKSIV